MSCAIVQFVQEKGIAKMLKHFSPHVFVLIHNRIRLRRERYSEGPLVFAKGGQTGVFSSFFSKHFILVFGFVFLSPSGDLGISLAYDNRTTGGSPLFGPSVEILFKLN